MLRPFYLTLLVFSLLISGCTYTQKIKDGKTAYERMQYAVAVKMLTKEYNKAKSRLEKGKIAYLLGDSYRRMNNNEASIPWYQTAYDNQYGIDALKQYAFALKQNEQYKEAAEAFKNLGLEIGSPYEYRREITACNQAIAWLGILDQAVYQVESAPFNTGDAEYAPIAYGANQLLITSDRKSSVGENTYNWTGNSFSDLFLVDLGSSNVASFDASINTANNEGTVAFNESFTEMFFTRCFADQNRADAYCRLMVTTKEGDSWSIPEQLNFIEDKVNYGHPALSADGSILYFSANHPEGWGGYDIYYAERIPNGWEVPQLLGRSINTEGDEKFPFIDKDTLYFASDQHVGMGGLDIFKTYKMDNDSWAPVQNLKPPLNSGSDDFAFIVDYRAEPGPGVIQQGYFSSSRKAGKGNDDIFRFEKRNPPPPPPADTTKTPEPIVYKMLLNGYVLEKIYRQAGNPNSEVIGRKPLDQSKVQIVVNGTTETVTVGPDGLFTLVLAEESDYTFNASHVGYLNNSGRFSSKGIGKDPNNPITTYEVEIILDKIFKDREIVLENIYYDFDESFIREDAKPQLNKLAEILRQNPEIRIQLSSHTDCQGNANYNQGLSQERAQAAVDYLISLGLSAERLSAKGYGEELLAVNCICNKCTEEEHQINRRTTFKILE
jgi:peptidoglycan-associated lipoprotein